MNLAIPDWEECWAISTPEWTEHIPLYQVDGGAGTSPGRNAGETAWDMGIPSPKIITAMALM
jgi:hypothetical protein